MARTARAAPIILLVCSVLAGCSALGGDPEHRVRVVDQNGADDATTVTALQDGKRVELDGEDEPNYESALTLGGAGEYRLRVSVENESAGNANVTSPDDGGMSVTVGVDEDGRVRFETGDELD